MVSDGVYGPETLGEINDENFNNLLDVHHGEFLAQGGLEAGALILAANLMPFVYARYKKQINKEQFEKVLKKFIPNITARTLHRTTLLSVVGPLYFFFLISKIAGKVFIDGLDDDIDEEVEKKKDKQKILGIFLDKRYKEAREVYQDKKFAASKLGPSILRFFCRGDPCGRPGA